MYTKLSNFYKKRQKRESKQMINKLIANIKKTNAPIVVGLDPMLNYVPEHVQKKAFAEYGETLEGAAEPFGSSIKRLSTQHTI